MNEEGMGDKHDPPRLAKDARSEEEALAHYRRVRHEIRHFIEHLDDHVPLNDGEAAR